MERIPQAISDYLSVIRLFNRDVILFLINLFFFGFTVFGGIYSVLLNLYLLRLGYGPEFIGSANAGARLSLAAFSLIAGILGKRWGSRRAMIIGTTTILLGFVAIPLVEFIPATLQREWIVVTYSIAWIGVAMYFVNSTPFLTEITTSKDRNHAFSVRAAMTPLAGFAGSLIGGLLPGLIARTLKVSLNQPDAYRYTLLLAAMLIIPGLLAIKATRGEGRTQTEENVVDSGGLPLGIIVFLSLVWLLRWAGSGAAHTFFNVYLDAELGVSTATIGVLAAVGQLLAIPVALSFPPLAAYWGVGGPFVLGSLAMALGLVPMLIFPHWATAGFGFVGMTVLQSMTRTSISVYQMEVVSPKWRTMMSAATVMAAGLGWAIMAFGGGFIITALGYNRLFLTTASLVSTSALIFWVYLRIKRDGGRIDPTLKMSK